jgi:hypothetical protein
MKINAMVCRQATPFPVLVSTVWICGVRAAQLEGFGDMGPGFVDEGLMVKFLTNLR